MIDFKLNSDYDLTISKNDLSLIDSSAQIVQNIIQRLKMYTNEWFLNLSAGTPWITNILIKSPRFVEVDAILKVRIVKTEGVKELSFFEMTLLTERSLKVDFRAILNDNTEIQQTLSFAQ